MRKSTALILCCVLIFVSAADDVNKKTTTPKTTTIIPTTTINTTTSPPETTTVPNTTTEEPVPTTTPTPTTTTAKSTTQTPTTTPTPSTTTNAPITTTPVPVGPPKMGKWNVTGVDGLIIAQMAAQLQVMYNGTNKQNVSRAVIDVPNDAIASGNFDKNDEFMKLSWKSAGVGDNYVIVSFKRDDKTYILSGIEVSIEPENLPGLNSTMKLVHKQEHFNTTLGNSYRCVRLQAFNLTAENDLKIVVGRMEVSDLQFQAFKADKKANFGLAEDCAFDTPDIVPIAVGCVLAGLVVIVLAAYLFSRRRSQSRGYLKAPLYHTRPYELNCDILRAASRITVIRLT